jgi:hypothetical protein
MFNSLMLCASVMKMERHITATLAIVNTGVSDQCVTLNSSHTKSFGCISIMFLSYIYANMMLTVVPEVYIIGDFFSV